MTQSRFFYWCLNSCIDHTVNIFTMAVHVSLKWKGESPSSCIQNFFHGISFTSIEIKKHVKLTINIQNYAKRNVFETFINSFFLFFCAVLYLFLKLSIINFFSVKDICLMWVLTNVTWWSHTCFGNTNLKSLKHDFHWLSRQSHSEFKIAFIVCLIPINNQ